MDQGAGQLRSRCRPSSLRQSCISRGSIVSTEFGVFYVSPDGLCVISNQGYKVLTDSVMTREQWQGQAPRAVAGGGTFLTANSVFPWEGIDDLRSIIGAFYNGEYYGFMYRRAWGILLQPADRRHPHRPAQA